MTIGLILGLLIGSALGAIAGAGTQLIRQPRGADPQHPLVRMLEDHPPGCICKGTGESELGEPCPMLWRRPQDKVRLVGRLPRGSQR